MIAPSEKQIGTGKERLPISEIGKFRQGDVETLSASYCFCDENYLATHLHLKYFLK